MSRQLPEPETLNYAEACRYAEILEMAAATLHTGHRELETHAFGYRIRAAALLASHMDGNQP